MCPWHTPTSYPILWSDHSLVNLQYWTSIAVGAVVIAVCAAAATTASVPAIVGSDHDMIHYALLWVYWCKLSTMKSTPITRFTCQPSGCPKGSLTFPLTRLLCQQPAYRPGGAKCEVRSNKKAGSGFAFTREAFFKRELTPLDTPPTTQLVLLRQGVCA